MKFRRAGFIVFVLALICAVACSHKPSQTISYETFTAEHCGGYRGYQDGDVGFIASVVLHYDSLNSKLPRELQAESNTIVQTINNAIIAQLKSETNYNQDWQRSLALQIKSDVNKILTCGAISNVTFQEHAFLKAGN